MTVDSSPRTAYSRARENDRYRCVQRDFDPPDAHDPGADSLPHVMSARRRRNERSPFPRQLRVSRERSSQRGSDSASAVGRGLGRFRWRKTIETPRAQLCVRKLLTMSIGGTIGVGDSDARGMEDRSLFARCRRGRLVERPADGRVGVETNDCACCGAPLLGPLDAR